MTAALCPSCRANNHAHEAPGACPRCECPVRVHFPVFDVNTLHPYEWRERERAEFDALLVGPPTTGGLIRHRAKRRGRLLAFVSGVVNALGGWLR